MVHGRRITYCVQTDLHFVRSFIRHAAEAAAEGDLLKALAILIYNSLTVISSNHIEYCTVNSQPRPSSPSRLVSMVTVPAPV